MGIVTSAEEQGRERNQDVQAEACSALMAYNRTTGSVTLADGHD